MTTPPRHRIIDMPGTKPLRIKVPPEDQCPSCQRVMEWIEARNAYICVKCNQIKEGK